MAARKKSTRKSPKASGTKTEKKTASARSARTRSGGITSSSQRKRSTKAKTSPRKKVVAKAGQKTPAAKRKRNVAEATRVSRKAQGGRVKAAEPKTAAAAKKSIKGRKTARASAEGHAVKPAQRQAEVKVEAKNESSKRPEAGAAPLPQTKPVKAGAPAAVNPAAGQAAPAVKAPANREQKPVVSEAASQASKGAKPSGPRQGFKVNEFVVYPAHGVGQVVAIEEQEVAGFKLELFVISFSKDKMTLRVPTSKVTAVGMRKISDPEAAKRSLDILSGRARIKRTMWSRRAQEYETKINSGDINAIAEVVRDLYRSEAQPEQSYSERQLYEAALDRMVREISVVQKSNEIDALKAVEAQLQKSQGRTKPPSAPQGEAKDPEIEEAA